MGKEKNMKETKMDGPDHDMLDEYHQEYTTMYDEPIYGDQFPQKHRNYNGSIKFAS